MGERFTQEANGLTLSLIMSAIWAIAATIVACLPMRFQYRPGLMLLLIAPILIGWVGYDYGWWVSVLALLGFVSMFRNPLRYLWRLVLKKEQEELP